MSSDSGNRESRYTQEPPDGVSGSDNMPAWEKKMFKSKKVGSFVLRTALVAFALTAASGEVYAKKNGKPAKKRNPPTTQSVDSDGTGNQSSGASGSTGLAQNDGILTGCLHKEGQLRRFAEGDTPVKPCNPNEQVVQLLTAGTGSGVEPFALAFTDGETKVLAEQGAQRFELSCSEGSAQLDAIGTIINGVPSFVPLSEPVDDSTLPALLGDDGSFLSVHNVHVAFDVMSAACVMTGIVQRSTVEFP